MSKNGLLAVMGVAVVIVLWYGWRGSDPASEALTGQVSSSEEGLMEGVLVSAQRVGSTITVTVVTDSQGRYSFPRERLEAGQYKISIRAAGYDLPDPATVDILGDRASQANLTLEPTKDLAAQLTNTEWILSLPLKEEEKAFLFGGYGGCVGCHNLEPVFQSRFTAAEFVPVIRRMEGYSQGSARFYAQGNRRIRVQRRPQGAAGGGEERPRSPQEQVAKVAEYLSKVNLSSASTWEYPLKTLPRPTGKATRVIITEYDLPRPDTQPHDAAVDSEGMVWYADFGQQYLGKLDPKTGEVVEYPLPVLKPGFPVGLLDVRFDYEGNVWMGMMWQGGVAKFDRKTEKFQTWGSPNYQKTDEARIAMVDPRQAAEGRVWVAGQSEWILNLKTGEWVDLGQILEKTAANHPRAANRPHSIYQIVADSKSSAYYLDMGSEYIGKMDAEALKLTLFETPTFRSTPRRGHVDAKDRVWFAAHNSNRIGVFDPKSEQFREWEMPTPWTQPYDVILDKSEEAWTGGMFNDRVVRVNTETGEMIEYLLPRSTNIRRVNVDNSTNPVTFWVGNNLGASIIKLEPLE